MIGRTVITIDGIDGSGKSTLARRLHAAVSEAGSTAIIIRVDDFRRPVAWSTGPSEAELYYDAYYDLDLCERCLVAFAAGVPSLAIPVFDAATERLDGSRLLELGGANVAIVEGVFPLRLRSAANGLVIYLASSEAAARRRIIARDLQRGRARAEIERRIEQRYFPSQRRYHELFDPRGRADVVIDNEDPAEPRVTRRELGRLAEPLRGVLDRALP